MTLYVDNPFSCGKYELTGEGDITAAAREFECIITEASEKLTDSLNATMEHYVWDEVDRATLKMKHVYNVEVKAIY